MAQFQPGQSGNPDGRPKGTTDIRKIFDMYVKEDVPEMIEKAKQLAKEGNEQMLKMFLERLLPAKPKDNLVNVNLTGDTLTEKSKQITEALSNQYITPSEAMDMMQTLSSQARIFDVDELAKLLQKTLEFRDQLKKEDRIK